ncbi:12126_t:CDS:2 [Entrophospora sp. SA101]|nr:12126_t:CDS:2 [Entrophospora sp. SA101]
MSDHRPYNKTTFSFFDRKQGKEISLDTLHPRSGIASRRRARKDRKFTNSTFTTQEEQSNSFPYQSQWAVITNDNKSGWYHNYYIHYMGRPLPSIHDQLSAQKEDGIRVYETMDDNTGVYPQIQKVSDNNQRALEIEQAKDYQYSIRDIDHGSQGRGQIPLDR